MAGGREGLRQDPRIHRAVGLHCQISLSLWRAQDLDKGRNRYSSSATHFPSLLPFQYGHCALHIDHGCPTTVSAVVTTKASAHGLVLASGNGTLLSPQDNTFHLSTASLHRRPHSALVSLVDLAVLQVSMSSWVSRVQYSPALSIKMNVLLTAQCLLLLLYNSQLTGWRLSYA